MALNIKYTLSSHNTVYCSNAVYKSMQNVSFIYNKITKRSEMSSFVKVSVYSVCPSLRLLLVLSLCGCVEVVQDALHVIKGGPLFRFVLPAGRHDFVQLGGAGVRLRHSVASLNRGHHLSFSHTWGKHSNVYAQAYMKDSTEPVVVEEVILITMQWLTMQTEIFPSTQTVSMQFSHQ